MDVQPVKARSIALMATFPKQMCQVASTLVLDTQTLEFGTGTISPLYRYMPNKKELSEAENSLVVTPLERNWNLLRNELLRWYNELVSLQIADAIPAAA